VEAEGCAGPKPAAQAQQDEDRNLEGAGSLERDKANFHCSLKL